MEKMTEEGYGNDLGTRKERESTRIGSLDWTSIDWRTLDWSRIV